MVDKIEHENQDVSSVSPGLRVGKSLTPASFKPGHGGSRAGSGRPKGSGNRITQTFRDVLLQALSEVGDSEKVGEDGQGGLLGFFKKCAVLERKTTLLLAGRILPLKISTEVRKEKEKMSIEEAVADLKALGMEPLLALYLKRYPLEPDDGDPEWAKMINMELVPDPLADVVALEKSVTEMQKDDTGNDTAE